VQRHAEASAADHSAAELDLAELHALRTELGDQMDMVGEEIRVKARRLNDYASLALEVKRVRQRYDDPW
jgi:hypothetical protein